MKWSKLLLAGAFLLGCMAAAQAQRPQAKPGGEPEIVAVPSTKGAMPGTRFLRLEYRLRILAQFFPGYMRVHTVFPGGPATRLHLKNNPSFPGALEPGDIVTHVDGRPITSMNDYYRAMYLTGRRGGKTTISVRDVNSGRIYVWETTAERVGGDTDPPIRKDGRRATRVKALLIGDTNDERIGAGCAKNLENMSRYVRGLPGFVKADLTVLDGRRVTARTIREAIQGLKVGPTETLFCYWAGHGAHDRSLAGGDAAGGHFFQLPGGDMMRRDVLGMLRARGAQLTVLISDTCNMPSRFGPPLVGAPLPTEKPPIKSKVLADLLFGYVGVVDVSGTTHGQYGWYVEDGGWFTLGLLITLEEWAPGKASVWKDFLNDTSNNASKVFQKLKRAILASREPSNEQQRATRQRLRNQADQRPETFRLEVYRVER